MRKILLNSTVSTKDIIKLEESKTFDKDTIIPFVSDVMFKILLGNESKRKFTAYFLSLVLDKDYRYIEKNMKFVKNELDQENYYESKRSVDLIIELDNKFYNIEMNNNWSKESIERNIDYASKVYSSSRYKGHLIILNMYFK